MKISEGDRVQLWAAQHAQSAIGKLRTDLANLKNNPELALLESERSTTLSALQQQTGQLDLLNAECKRLESDLEVVNNRIQRDQQLLLTMASPKDIAGVEHELVTLRDRLDALETQELEAFEKIDAVKQRMADLETLLTEQQAQIANLEQTTSIRSAELVADLRESEGLWKQALESLPVELANLLQQLWSRGSGVGELSDTTCGVCHMGLNSSAINEIKRTPSDELVQCPECRAILVSGGGG
jgi:predicted  nucleic acid-binding Zn-ribbon protein